MLSEKLGSFFVSFAQKLVFPLLFPQNQSRQNKEQEDFEQMMSFEKDNIENGNV